MSKSPIRVAIVDDEASVRTALARLLSASSFEPTTYSSAREFIEQVATKSSLSGEPYRIRLRDGSEVFSGQYLSEVLDRIEQGR